MEYYTKMILILFVLITIAGGLCMAKEAEPVPREAKLPEMMMAGVAIVDSTETESYMKLWEEFFRINEQITEAIGDAYYGINFMTKNAEGKDAWGYMVATQVKSLDKLPEGLISRIIPACDYIVFEHHGPVEKVSKLYEYIYGTYSHNGKHKFLYADSLERYDHRFKDGSEDSIMEIWIPVQSGK